MNCRERLLQNVGCTALLLLMAWHGSALADAATVTILQTTDVHGHFSPGPLPENGGDWLRLATLIEDERRIAGEGGVLLIDCGDTCQGSQITAHSRGEIAARMLVTMRYDVWVPGNHDLDFGVLRCLELCQAVGKATLCGNLILSANGTTTSWPSWRLFTRNGARVAVIGATASYLDQWLWGKAMEGYRVEKAEAMLERVLPEVLEAKPDMVILAIHQGWLENDPRNVNEITAVANRFPEIDLILGGHTHRPMSGMKIGGRTWYVQAGERGSHLGVIKATIDREAHRVVQVESRLLDVTPEIRPLRTALEAMGDLLEAAIRMSDTRIGSLGAPLNSSGTPGETCQASELLCMAIAEKTNARMVLHGRLSRGKLEAGPISERDLFTLVPYENAIGIAELLPSDLAVILEEQEQNRKSYVYNGPWGIVVRMDSAKRVTHLEWPDGRPVKPDEKIRVAMNSYTIAGGGGRFPELRRILARADTTAYDTTLMTRDVLRNYIAKHPNLQIESRQWVFRQRQTRSEPE